MSRKTTLRPAPVGDTDNPDSVFAHSVAVLDGFRRRERRRYGKWAPLVQWAAAQKIQTKKE